MDRQHFSNMRHRNQDDSYSYMQGSGEQYLQRANSSSFYHQGNNYQHQQYNPSQPFMNERVGNARPYNNFSQYNQTYRRDQPMYRREYNQPNGLWNSRERPYPNSHSHYSGYNLHEPTYNRQSYSNLYRGNSMDYEDPYARGSFADYPLYDINDVNTFNEMTSRDDYSTNDSSFWMNVPSGEPTLSFPPRSYVAYSDSMYLDPLECEGMRAFNTDIGVYAPSMHSSYNRAPMMVPPKPKVQPSLQPPARLAALWNNSVYHAIWESFDEAKKQYLLSLSGADGPTQQSDMNKKIEMGIQEKKRCRITKARSAFVEIAIEFANNVQGWLEFTRLEMECGEYKNARVVLECAASLHPHNELILQKRLRVEERLRDPMYVIQLIDELCSMDTQKSMKILVEGIGVLCKLGYEKLAREYGLLIANDSKYFSGNLYLELMLCEQRCGLVDVLWKMASQALILFPKYGPLWFFSFHTTEHLRLLSWNKKNMFELLRTEDVETMAKKAPGNLTTDILWKVYLYRMEYWYRSCMYLRAITMEDPSRLEELLLCESKISDYVNQNMKTCVEVCPENLLWKLYITVARYCVYVGFRKLSRQLMQQAFSLVPVKSRHAVILDYSKTECIAKRNRCSLDLLNYGILHFPMEWKLLLERIQQLVLAEQYTDALRLNIDVLKTHLGAGRLWSSYIHIIHQMFGPDVAMTSFREALKHVAKSGEVWCEGARIYMNPVSKYFHLYNAEKCLNYAVFFTPQYGDSFIEAIRLAVLSSDHFLEFHSISSSLHLSLLLRSYNVMTFIMKRCSFFEPNYGPLWFRCQEFVLSSPKEILYRSFHITVIEIAHNKDVYYEAMMRRSIKQYIKKHGSNPQIEAYKKKYCKHRISPSRTLFSYSFKPEYLMTHLNEQQQLIRQMKSLYGASQLDN